MKWACCLYREEPSAPCHLLNSRTELRLPVSTWTSSCWSICLLGRRLQLIESPFVFNCQRGRLFRVCSQQFRKGHLVEMFAGEELANSGICWTLHSVCVLLGFYVFALFSTILRLPQLFCTVLRRDFILWTADVCSNAFLVASRLLYRSSHRFLRYRFEEMKYKLWNLVHLELSFPKL